MLRLPIIYRKLVVSRGLSTVAQHETTKSEYNETAEYPAIQDQSYRVKKNRKRLEWHEKIKKIGTIEEKLIEINLPKYYGYKCTILNDREYPYNTLPFFQYATNTQFVEEADGHAAASEEEAKTIENFLNQIKSDIQDAVEFELDGYK